MEVELHVISEKVIEETGGSSIIVLQILTTANHFLEHRAGEQLVEDIVMRVDNQINQFLSLQFACWVKHA